MESPTSFSQSPILFIKAKSDKATFEIDNFNCTEVKKSRCPCLVISADEKRENSMNNDHILVFNSSFTYNEGSESGAILLDSPITNILIDSSNFQETFVTNNSSKVIINFESIYDQCFANWRTLSSKLSIF